jgi:hypothetical protein
LKIPLNRRADVTHNGSVVPVSVNFYLEVAYIGELRIL